MLVFGNTIMNSVNKLGFLFFRNIAISMLQNTQIKIANYRYTGTFICKYFFSFFSKIILITLIEALVMFFIFTTSTQSIFI